MDNLRPLTDADGIEPVYWLDPRKHKPPPGTKLFLLTDQKTAVVGKWEPVGYRGWRPLFKIPEGLK